MNNLNTLTNEVESRISRWQEELQKQSSQLHEINLGIKRLKSSKILTQANMDKIMGAIEAFSEASRLMREENAKKTASEAKKAPTETEKTAPKGNK